MRTSSGPRRGPAAGCRVDVGTRFWPIRGPGVGGAHGENVGAVVVRGEDPVGSSQADLGWGVVSGRVAVHGVCGEDLKGAVSGHRERKEVRAGHRQRHVLDRKDISEQ